MPYILRRWRGTTITKIEPKQRTQELCFEAYSVLYSEISRTSLYLAEHLTWDKPEAAKTRYQERILFTPNPPCQRGIGLN